MPDFTGKVVMVTGAAGTLGYAVASQMAELGANCVLLDLHLDRLAARYPEKLDNQLLVAADLTDATSLQSTVDQVLTRYDQIDSLINVAGGFRMGPRIHETTEEDWDRMLDMNARSVFLACRAVLPSMLKQGNGKIVNVAARAALAGKGKMAPYIVSKAAVLRLTESLASEYKQDNINVNCILPGTIDTPQNRQDMPTADFNQWVAPAALADVICFLASDAARAIHGAAVPVYGLS